MFLDAPGERLERILGERVEDVLLVGEVGIDGHRCIADALGQLADGQAFIAFFLDELVRGLDKLAAQFRLVFLPALLDAQRHCLSAFGWLMPG